MRTLAIGVFAVLLATAAVTAFANVVTQPATVAPRAGDMSYDVPAGERDGVSRSDTIGFGYFTIIGGTYYAVPNDKWTWDHGSSNVFEGWYAVDGTQNTGAF